MKNIYILSIICLFCIYIFSGCTSTYAQRGAYVGGYTGALGSVIGKGDITTTAVASGIGAVTGYIIGNEIDKQQLYYNVKPKINQYSTIPKQSYYNTNQYNPNHIYIDQQQHPNERTNCKKITTKKIFSDGSHEVTVEEICEGRRITNTY
jgi:uncharacterized protein YcfJ